MIFIFTPIDSTMRKKVRGAIASLNFPAVGEPRPCAQGRGECKSWFTLEYKNLLNNTNKIAINIAVITTTEKRTLLSWINLQPNNKPNNAKTTKTGSSYLPA